MAFFPSICVSCTNPVPDAASACPSSGGAATVVAFDGEPGGSDWYDPQDQWSAADESGDDGSGPGSGDPGGAWVYGDDGTDAPPPGDDDTGDGTGDDSSGGDGSGDDSGGEAFRIHIANETSGACVPCAIACATDTASGSASAGQRAYALTLASDGGYEDACNQTQAALVRWIHRHASTRVGACRRLSPDDGATTPFTPASPVVTGTSATKRIHFARATTTFHPAPGRSGGTP